MHRCCAEPEILLRLHGLAFHWECGICGYTKAIKGRWRIRQATGPSEDVMGTKTEAQECVTKLEAALK